MVVKTKAGEVTVATLKRRTAKALELQPLDASQAEHTMRRATSAGSRECVGEPVIAS